MELATTAGRFFGTGMLALLGACSADPSGTAGAGSGTAGAGSFAAGGSTGSSTDTPLGSAAVELTTPLVRRLTRDEVADTLGDVLGVQPTAEELAPLPLDRPLEGFVNTATSQTVSPEHVLGYASVARAVARRIDAGLLGAQAGCTETSSECQARFVTGIGKLVFRRPLDADENAAFTALFQAAVTEGTNFVEAARVVLEAMLQSPQFLYRLERETAAASGVAAGQVRAVVGYEMATRLSYMLWGSAPDPALYLAAEAGSLDHAAGVGTELTRMLQDTERSRRPTQRFLTDWARLESLPDNELRAELVSSVLAFYDDFVWKKRAPLLELLTAKSAFLTPTLAQNYGLTPAGDGILEYGLAGFAGRGGLLTQPGFLAGMTNADGGAIVARGLYLQSQLFCLETPSPPTSLQGMIDEFVAEQPPTSSTRQIAEVRLKRPECGACHQTFDPLAYGLEQFDFQGRFRAQDQFGNTLTTDGWVPARFTEAGENAPYQGVDDYMKLLSQSPAVGACLARQHLQFALGRRLEGHSELLAAELFAQLSAQGGTYPAMLAVIASHPLFRELKAE